MNGYGDTQVRLVLLVQENPLVIAEIYTSCHRCSEIDNAAYSIALSERVRRRVEQNGRIDLSDGEAAELARIKTVHASLIAVTMVLSILTANGDATFYLAFLVFWLGGVAEAVGPGGPAGVIGKRVGKVTGACVFGTFTFGVFKTLAF